MRAAALLILLLSCLPCQAFDFEFETVVQGPQPSQYVHFLIDLSGSMYRENKEDEKPADRAEKLFYWALEQFADQGWIKVTLFDVGCVTYSNEWIKMPDAVAFRGIRNWIKLKREVMQTGGTDIGGAIAYAAEEDANFTVVLVTDGSNTCGNLRALLLESKTRRADRGLKMPAVIVVGIQCRVLEPQHSAIVDMSWVANETGGGFYAEGKPRDEGATAEREKGTSPAIPGGGVPGVK